MRQSLQQIKFVAQHMPIVMRQNCHITRQKNFSHTIKQLTLSIPSHFGPTLYTKEWGVSGPPPTTSSTLSCTNIKFCKASEIPFKVSKNKRLVKKIFCMVTMATVNMLLFPDNFQNVYEKTGNFQMLPETINFKVLK